MRLASAMNASTDSALSPLRYSTDIRSPFPLVYSRQQPLRRYETIRSFETIRYFSPIRPAIEVDPEPPRRADIWRHEIPIRPARDHHLLCQVNSLAPHRIAASAVMVPRAREHREHALVHPERWLAVRDLLPRLRQREA